MRFCGETFDSEDTEHMENKSRHPLKRPTGSKDYTYNGYLYNM